MVARAVFSVTPSDTVDLPGVTTAGIYVGGTGNVTVLTEFGSVAQFQSVPAGTILPVSARRIYSTGTSATLMVGMIGQHS